LSYLGAVPSSVAAEIGAHKTLMRTRFVKTWHQASAAGCARPYGMHGASLVSWRGLPSGWARR